MTNKKMAARHDQRSAPDNIGTGTWKKISELKTGMKIAVPDVEGERGFSWDEVVSIKHVGRQEVWDI